MAENRKTLSSEGNKMKSKEDKNKLMVGSRMYKHYQIKE
jgi:hypothetical protein